MIKMRCVSVFFPMREAEKKARNSARLFFFARTVGVFPSGLPAVRISVSSPDYT